MRERLIELLSRYYGVSRQDEGVMMLAEWLLDNGVTTRCWFPVEEPPENEETVLVAVERRMYGGTTNRYAVAGFYTNGKTFTGNSRYNWDDGGIECEYSEKYDEFIVPEGWWESVFYGEEFAAISDVVIGWMPMPEPPGEG